MRSVGVFGENKRPCHSRPYRRTARVDWEALMGRATFKEHGRPGGGTMGVFVNALRRTHPCYGGACSVGVFGEN